MLGLTGNTEPRPGSIASHIEEVIEAFRDLLSPERDGALFTWRRGGATHHLTRVQYRHAVVALKDRMVESGLDTGERIAIFSESNPEWPIVFVAAMRAGLTVVPVDARATDAEILHILNHAGPAAIYVSRELRPRVEKLKAQLQSVREITTMDGDDDFPSLLALAESDGKHRYAERELSLNSTAVIAYTSGTLGTPKGVMLPASALWYEVISLQRIFQSRREDIILSMLPMNHMFEMTCGLFAAMFTRARIVFANSLLPTELMDLMQEHGVTRMVTVPLFLEHVHRAIYRELNKRSPLARRAFRAMLKTAPLLPWGWRRRLFAGLHRKFGGRLSLFIVGGAPLRKDIGAFFEAIGIRVRQGYGLTETSPVITVNRPLHNRNGSVGVPLDGIEVRIDRDRPDERTGEIVVRGPNVMQGYYRNEEYTNEVLDRDGWFRTGDIGFIDDKGFLWITGRKKNLIVLSGGKKVWPEEVEEALAASPLVAEVCVLGVKSTDVTGSEGERVVAVIRPDPTQADLSKERVSEEVKAFVIQLATFKRPTKVIVYPHEFPKTATRKVKRLALLEKLKEEKYL